MKKITLYKEPLAILSFVLNNPNITISKKCKLKNDNSDKFIYRLKGIIYHRQFHFNSCIITPDKTVWFHDEITTCKNCIKENTLNECTSNNLIKACLLIYSRDL
jgi:hypothetical protein